MLHILISYITLRYVLFTHYLRIIYAFKMVMLKEVPKGLGIGSAGGIGSKSKGRVSYSKADVGGGDDWDDVINAEFGQFLNHQIGFVILSHRERNAQRSGVCLNVNYRVTSCQCR